MLSLNTNLVHTGTPPIPQAQAWARRYDRSRGLLLDLSQAVPGYPPHPAMLERMAQAAGDPARAGYGAILGDAPLREAYAAHVSAVYRSEIRPGEVAITAGCNQAFFVAAIALAKAGDAVLLPSPWYFNHAMTLRMLGVEARALPCRPDQGFVPDPVEAEALLDARVRAIVLVTPNNPTGAVYPPETVARFAELSARRGVALVLDETYRDVLPERHAKPHAAFGQPDWRDTVVGLYSFSKSYCIPGHRLGAIMAGERLIAQFAKVLDCAQICPARPGQAALAWAIGALTEWREANRLDIMARAAALRRAVELCEGWRIDSMGGYFAYLAHPFEAASCDGVAEGLATRRGLLGLPGTWFGSGQAGHLRIAFANADSDAIAGLPERLRDFTP